MLEAIKTNLVGSQPPWEAGFVTSDGPSVQSYIPCRDKAPCEENLAV